MAPAHVRPSAFRLPPRGRGCRLLVLAAAACLGGCAGARGGGAAAATGNATNATAHLAQRAGPRGGASGASEASGAPPRAVLRPRARSTPPSFHPRPAEAPAEPPGRRVLRRRRRAGGVTGGAIWGSEAATPAGTLERARRGPVLSRWWWDYYAKSGLTQSSYTGTYYGKSECLNQLILRAAARL